MFLVKAHIIQALGSLHWTNDVVENHVVHGDPPFEDHPARTVQNKLEELLKIEISPERVEKLEQ